MAYNPFNIFRRNQKALFAVLTVFIMIMFTLSFGKGDFFDRVPQWLGASRGEGVCKIDGRDVMSKDLHGAHGLDFKRRMANRFMALAATQSVQSLSANLREQHGRVTGQAKTTAENAMQISEAWLSGQLPPIYIMQLPNAVAAMTEIIESPNARSEEKEVARSARVLFLLIHKIAMGGSSHYFLNAPNKSDRDLIEFVLWEKKADQLGISFTREDTSKLIQAEFDNSFKSDVKVREEMKSMQGFTIEACLDAIATEFKVRTAQTAILGQRSRVHQAPAYTVPYEMFEYYRDQCSPAVYEVIGVPVSAFVPQVQGQPTAEEKKALYDKHQSEEPNPKSETPGFKEPRKISVSWLGITGEEPYYKKLAEEQVKVGETMAKASGMLTVPLPGALNTWAMAATAPLTLKEPAIDSAYNTYTNQFKMKLREQYSNPSLYVRDFMTPSLKPGGIEAQLSLVPTNTVKPAVLAATVGGLVGQTAGFGNPLAAVSVSMMVPIRYEMFERVKVGTPLVLGFTPGPALLPSLVGAAALSNHHEPKPLPADVMRAELLKTTIDARAKVIAFGTRQEKGDVQRFAEELVKPSEDGKVKDKAAQEKYIQEFITSRGLTQFGKSTAPRDEWSLEEDPGLQPLVLAHQEHQRQPSSHPLFGNDYAPFGQSFFWTRDFDRATFRPRRGPATTGLYKVQPFESSSNEEGKPHYIVWRTEDIAPKKTNRDTAEVAVIAAWKRIKARELAQNFANTMAERIRTSDKNDPLAISQFLQDRAREIPGAVSDPKIERRVKPFPINEVCPRVPDITFGQGGMPVPILRPFEIRESEKIPYPTADMQTALLENRDKPAKTVLVLPDAPKDTFYVATLIRRELRSLDEFRANVYSPVGRARSIQGQFLDESMKKSHESVLDLLKKEFKYEETEEQKKKLDDQMKSGNRDRD